MKKINGGRQWRIEAKYVDLGKRRTEFLLEPSHQQTTPLHTLLANAYLCGMADCVDAGVRATPASPEVK